MVPLLRDFGDQKLEKQKSRHQTQKPIDMEIVQLILTPPEIDPNLLYLAGIGPNTNKKTLFK